MKAKLRCYVCGKDINAKRFAIVTPGNDRVDRAFFMHEDGCLEQTDDEGQPSLIVGEIQ